MKKIFWNGIEYDTIKEAAIANGVEYRTMYQRIKKGYTSDQEICLKRNKGEKIIWNDIEYPSITKAAKENGISWMTMKNWLMQFPSGWKDSQRVNNGS